MLDVLRAGVLRAARKYCDNPGQRAAVLKRLARPGYALHSESPCRSGVLALQVYKSICGELDEPAWQAAVAAELYMEAGFLFDDVADEEIDPRLGSSVAEEVALALTILNCGAAAACEAAEASGRRGARLSAVRGMFQDCISASAGQLMDARLQRHDVATTNEALEMTELKAGSCGRLVASFGASIATEDDDLIRLFGELGFNLLVHSQLIDDLRDACPAQGISKDLAVGKKTVPLVYFFNSLPEGRAGVGDGIMWEEWRAKDGHCFRRAFDATGANVFGAVVAERYLNRAKAILADLSGRLGNLDSLERFVDTIQLDPKEIRLVE